MYNSRVLLFIMLMAFSVTLSSCELAGDLVKGGIWVGAIGVFLVVALVWWLVGKAKGGGPQ